MTHYLIVEKDPKDTSSISVLLAEGAIHCGTVLLEQHTFTAKAVFRKFLIELDADELLIFKLKYNSIVTIEPLSNSDIRYYGTLGYIPYNDK